MLLESTIQKLVQGEKRKPFCLPQLLLMRSQTEEGSVSWLVHYGVRVIGLRRGGRRSGLLWGVGSIFPRWHTLVGQVQTLGLSKKKKKKKLKLDICMTDTHVQLMSLPWPQQKRWFCGWEKTLARLQEKKCHHDLTIPEHQEHYGKLSRDYLIITWGWEQRVGVCNIILVSIF